MNNKKNLAFLVILALSLMTPGCGVVNSLRAKNSLNDGVREFNKGKYEVAAKTFARSLELNPDLTNAQLFYARALNAQFDQSLTDDLGKQTIDAYDEIISKNQNKPDVVDQALAFKANIYNQLTRANPERASEYRAHQRETLEKRATLSSATMKTKADVYYTLGVGYWQESYDLNASYVSHNKPIPQNILDQMPTLVENAFKYLDKAIQEDPNYANAWFYKKLVYIEKMKYSPKEQETLKAEALKMQDKYMAMQKAQQQQAASDATAPSK